MSRSHKKNPVYTDYRRTSTRETKCAANRKVRRKEKRIVRGYLEEDPRYEDKMISGGKSYRKDFCSYDIHDWIMYESKQEAINRYENPRLSYYCAETGSYINAYNEYKDVQQYLNKSWKKTFYRK